MSSAPTPPRLSQQRQFVATEVREEEGMPAGCVAHREHELGDHLERYFVADDNRDQTFVFSGILGSPHVYVYPPSQALKRPWYTLVSMGASGTRMPVPQGIAEPHKFARCEFMCYVPPTWKMPTCLPSAGDDDKEHAWPFDVLRSLCEYVTLYKSVWVSRDHGLPNLRSPGAPFARGTKLTNIITLEPLNEANAERLSPVRLGDTDDDWVQLLLCVPVTAKEAQWKRDVGIERSLYCVVGDKRINPAGVAVDYVIDPTRPCCVDDLHLDAQIAETIRERERREEEAKQQKKRHRAEGEGSAAKTAGTPQTAKKP